MPLLMNSAHADRGLATWSAQQRLVSSVFFNQTSNGFFVSPDFALS